MIDSNLTFIYYIIGFNTIFSKKTIHFYSFVYKLAFVGCFITYPMSSFSTQLTGQKCFIIISTQSCIESSFMLVQKRNVSIYHSFVVYSLVVVSESTVRKSTPNHPCRYFNGLPYPVPT